MKILNFKNKHAKTSVFSGNKKTLPGNLPFGVSQSLVCSMFPNNGIC
jgi:adenine specific DNA methylase Mod